MLKSLIHIFLQWRLYRAIRIRPFALARRARVRLLAKSGRRYAVSYLNANRVAIAKERKWLSQYGVEDNFFDLMTLYPSLPRALFIHIPKCGGTSIRNALVEDYTGAPIPLSNTGTLKQSIEYMTNAADKSSLQGEFLRQVATQGASKTLRAQYLTLFTSYCITLSPDFLFILGHQLGAELKPLCRTKKDFLFTTVRAPSEIMRSMLTYRVSHTLKNKNRPDSIAVLKATQLSYRDFHAMAVSQPQELAVRILSLKPPSLAAYLALGTDLNCASVWRDIRAQNIFIGHMSEQHQMLQQLFGKPPTALPKNKSNKHKTAAIQFSNMLEDSWVEPYIDTDSSLLYRKLEDTGIIGFWRNGGTPEQYRALLQSS